MSDSFLLLSILKPAGKGIPMKSPSGLMTKNARRNLYGNARGAILSAKVGRNIPHAKVSAEISKSVIGLCNPGME